MQCQSVKKIHAHVYFNKGSTEQVIEIYNFI